MALLGDIVEKNLDYLPQSEVAAHPSNATANGFPELYKPEKISSWKQRLRAKAARSKQGARPEPTLRKAEPSKNSKSEAESIHAENMNTIGNMSEEQVFQERRELLESLNPKLIQNLLKNINQRSGKNGEPAPFFAEIEGAPGTWVGGTNDLAELPKLNDKQVDDALGIKNLSISDDMNDDAKSTYGDEDSGEDEIEELLEFDDVDDIAPLDFQMAQTIDHMTNEELMSDVHFIKYTDPKGKANQEIDDKLNLNDPNFDANLHEMFFPDLPKEIGKLEWMKPVEEGAESKPELLQEVSQLRFDFKGNLVPPTREIKSTTHSALHHHSQDPQLAGYTIPELARLSRSTFPQQRSISIQVLGRILYKIGKQTYYQLVPEISSETYQEYGSTQKIMDKIYSMLWDLCKECNIIESLEDAADERKTSHLTVRNYAIDALWLWKNGGGDFRKDTLQESSK